MSFVDGVFADNLYIQPGPDVFDVTGEIARRQTNRLESVWYIDLAGKNITDRLNPHLIDIRITDKSLSAELVMEIDDRDGTMPIPPINTPLHVAAGWKTEGMVWMFDGVVFDVEHAGQRGQGGGRRMFVTGKGADYLRTHLKSPMQDALGDGAPTGQQEGTKHSFQDFAQQIMGNAKGTVSVHPALANKMRDWWEQSQESPQHVLQRLTSEFGGVMRIIGGNHAEITMPGQFVDGSGNGSVVAELGGNLISWRVKPLHSMLTWGGTSQQHYRTDIANWISQAASQALPAPWSSAIGTWSRANPGANQSEGGQDAEGDASQTGFPGVGRIVINGEPTAQWNQHVFLTGVRPGVDGTYLIKEAQHHWARPSGYITTLEVITVFAEGAQGALLDAQKRINTDAAALAKGLKPANPQSSAPNAPNAPPAGGPQPLGFGQSGAPL